MRSNYLWDEATHLYEKSLKLWEGLSQDLNYNVMFSQRGVLNLGHTLQDMRDIERRVNANRLNGVDGVVLDARAGEGRWCRSSTPRRTRATRSWAPRCSRAAAWRATTRWPGASPAAPMRCGVDIIQNCEVTGIRRDGGARRSASRPRAASSAAKKVGVVAAGHSQRARRHGRHALADREPSAAGAGVRADQAGARTRW